MGFDLCGRNPLNDTGNYFRNNVWWWRPLADYIQDKHQDIALECIHWHTNDNDGLSAKNSVRLAKRLEEDLANGKIKEFEQNHKKNIESIPLEECSQCKGTGIRTDSVGVKLNMPEQELDQSIALKVGRENGYCNGCQGLGKKDDIITWYKFSEENVRDFMNFCMASGGFTIG